MNTIEKIFDLIGKKELSEYKISKDTGLTNALFTQWKQGKQKPSTDAIIKIAKYFNVTTDYLLGIDTGQMTPQVLSKLDTEGIDKWWKLQEADKYYIIGQMDVLINKSKEKRISS